MKVNLKSLADMADLLEGERQKAVAKEDIGLQELADTVGLLQAALIALCHRLHAKGL